MTDIRCSSCNKLLGKQNGQKVEIKHGSQSLRVHGQGIVMLDCPRCKSTRDIELTPSPLRNST